MSEAISEFASQKIDIRQTAKITNACVQWSPRSAKNKSISHLRLNELKPLLIIYQLTENAAI